MIKYKDDPKFDEILTKICQMWAKKVDDKNSIETLVDTVKKNLEKKYYKLIIQYIKKINEKTKINDGKSHIKKSTKRRRSYKPKSKRMKSKKKSIKRNKKINKL